MTTSSSENEPWAEAHPLELLEAYALDALDEEETFHVESHLDWCGPCSREVARLHDSVAPLELIAERTAPPRELQARLMQALESASFPVSATDGGSRPNIWMPVARFLLPVAAMVMVGLFTTTVVLNVRLSDRLSNRTQSLERVNSTLTAQVAISMNENNLMEEKLNQLQLASYWLANPANQPLALKPTHSGESSKGVLLLAKDGSGAVIIITGMKDRSPTSTYQVWLMRQGDRVLVGRVKVDDRGWGTAAFWPKESLFRFDKIELISETVPGVVSTPADMVLEANIPGSLPSQMLVFPSWQ